MKSVLVIRVSGGDDQYHIHSIATPNENDVQRHAKWQKKKTIPAQILARLLGKMNVPSCVIPSVATSVNFVAISR